MSFANITMLWLFWAVPLMLLICLWGFRKRKRILSEYASEKGLSAICPDISKTRRWIKTTLLLMIVFLMAVSLAGPQYGYSWKKIERRGVDLVIALDCSRSMLARDIKPNRLERAKREVLDLLSMIEGDRVGLVAFAGTAFLQCPLTLDYEGFHLFLDALDPDFLPVGGTDISAAINTAVSAFDMEEATDKAVILITDGEATGEDPLSAAKAAMEADIRIFSIGIGSSDGTPIPDPEGGFIKDREGNIVHSKLDEESLKQMAAMTSGAYVRSVAGDMDLDVLYQQHIRNTMTAAELGDLQTKVFENRYQWLLGIALFLFILELFLPERKSYGILALLLLATWFPKPAIAGDLKELLQQAASAYESQDYEAAVQHYVSAQLEAPERAEISYDLGNAMYNAEDFDGAIRAYKEVLDSEDVTLKSQAHYNIGNAYYRKGNFDKAIESYETALSLNEADTQARENLEYVKRVKENPPPESSQGEQDPQDQDNQENEEENQQAGNQGKNDPDQQEESESEEEQQPPESSSDKDQERSSEPEENEAAADSPKEPSPPDPESLRQAEIMLNRLQDEPGRAMVPVYGQQQIEKDW